MLESPAPSPLSSWNAKSTRVPGRMTSRSPASMTTLPWIVTSPCQTISRTTGRPTCAQPALLSTKAANAHDAELQQHPSRLRGPVRCGPPIRCARLRATPRRYGREGPLRPFSGSRGGHAASSPIDAPCIWTLTGRIDGRAVMCGAHGEAPGTGASARSVPEGRSVLSEPEGRVARFERSTDKLRSSAQLATLGPPCCWHPSRVSGSDGCAPSPVWVV